MTHFKPTFRALIAFSLLLPLSACVTTDQDMPKQELLPKIALKTDTVTHEVRFALSSSTLTQAEKARMALFIEQSDIRSGDMIDIEAIDPATDPLAAKRQMRLVAFFEGQGIRTRSMSLPGSIGHRVRIAFRKITPTVTACTGWTDSDRYGVQNNPLMNLGCATQSNLINALADKRDIYQTQQPAGTPADRMVRLGKARVASGSAGATPLTASGFQAGGM